MCLLENNDSVEIKTLDSEKIFVPGFIKVYGKPIQFDENLWREMKTDVPLLLKNIVSNNTETKHKSNTTTKNIKLPTLWLKTMNLKINR